MVAIASKSQHLKLEKEVRTVKTNNSVSNEKKQHKQTNRTYRWHPVSSFLPLEQKTVFSSFLSIIIDIILQC